MTKDELVNVIRKYRYIPQPGDIVVRTTASGYNIEPWMRICLAVTADGKPVLDSGVDSEPDTYMYAKYCGEVKAAYEAFRGSYAKTEEHDYMGYELVPTLCPTDATERPTPYQSKSILEPDPGIRKYVDDRRIVRTECTVTYYE